MFEKLVAVKEIDLTEGWGEFLRDKAAKISNKFVCEWIKDKARKGAIGDKNNWERFQKIFAVPFFSITHTTDQACEITTRVGAIAEESRDFPSSVVVWNGNGVRARLDNRHSELKKVIHAVNPDLLCFLEAKINSENLFATPRVRGMGERTGVHEFILLLVHTGRKGSARAYHTDQNSACFYRQVFDGIRICR